MEIFPDIHLPPPPPLGTGGRTQTVPSTEILGTCKFCGTPLYKYEARDAFYGFGAHWDCSKTAAKIRQALKSTKAGDASPLGTIHAEDQEAYLKALECFESPTLATIILEYEVAEPKDITPDMAWKILLVRRVLRLRTGLSL